MIFWIIAGIAVVAGILYLVLEHKSNSKPVQLPKPTPIVFKPLPPEKPEPPKAKGPSDPGEKHGNGETPGQGNEHGHDNDNGHGNQGHDKK